MNAKGRSGSIIVRTALAVTCGPISVGKLATVLLTLLIYHSTFTAKADGCPSVKDEIAKSRTDPNWAVRGVRFGKADRDKSGKVLATVVEQMQREFSLTDDQDDAPQTKGAKPEVIQICRDEERASADNEHH